MKGFIAFLLVLVLAVNVYNWFEIRGLKEEVANLQTQVKDAKQGGISDQALQKAMDLMVQARVAVANTDWSKAKSAYESASQQIAGVAKAAGEKAGPALRWMQD